MTEIDFKLEFASLLYKGEPAIIAAEKLFAHYNVNQKFVNDVASKWPSDPIIIAELKRLDDQIPTKEELGLELLKKAREVFRARGFDEAAKFYKLSAEVLDLLKSNANKNDVKKAADKLDELASMLKIE